MSISTIEKATTFGALDLDAISDGSSYSALVARGLGRQANRLLAKRHQILSLVWPITASTVDDVSQYRAEWRITPLASMILPPLAMLKKPGITSGTLYLRALIPNGRKVFLRAGTLAIDAEQRQELECTGTGAWAWYSMTVALDPREAERLTLYARAADAGALLDTATYGSPASGTAAPGHITPTQLRIDSPHTLDTSLVDAGHYLDFIIDGSIMVQRPVLTMDDSASHAMLGFATLDLSFAVLLHSYVGSVSWELRQQPWLALGQVLVVTDERSL